MNLKLIVIFFITLLVGCNSTPDETWFTFNFIIPNDYSGPLYAIINTEKGREPEINQHIATLTFNASGETFIKEWRGAMPAPGQHVPTGFAKFQNGKSIPLDPNQNELSVRTIGGFGRGLHPMLPLGGAVFHIGTLDQYMKFKQNLR